MIQGLESILCRRCPPGIYRFRSRAQASTIRVQVESKGWRCFSINDGTIHDKASFLDAAATAMRFPDYFGSNWDALEECITDLSWAPAKGYLLLIEDIAAFAQHNPAEWHIALAILGDAVEYWQSRGSPLFVLLRRIGRTASHLPGI